MPGNPEQTPKEDLILAALERIEGRLDPHPEWEPQPEDRPPLHYPEQRDHLLRLTGAADAHAGLLEASQHANDFR